ncbi:MAG: hypothetical protein K9J77_11845, partial [Rhodoferax sp.]|nr:hypothetical protein [Rhodoferax sp.]
MTLYLAAGLLILATIFVVINHTKAKDALKKKPRVDPPSAEPTNGGKNFSVVTASASVTTHMAPTRVVPPELAALKLTKIADLSQPQIDLLTARLQDIPRPPHALDKLVSAEFLATATSTELNDLMVGEPQIA